MGTLAGKVVWVTGGGSGIGEAGAYALAEAGGHIVVSGRRQDAIERVAEGIKAKGGNAEPISVDVVVAEAVDRVRDAILAKHGRIDILVNSAGLNVPNRSWRDATSATLAHVIDVNLTGTLNCMASVVPSMRDRKDGLIINVSSWAGRAVGVMTGPAYHAAKHGVVAATMSFNMEECRNGLRATALCPGEVATDILRHRPVPPSPDDLSRMLQPDHLGSTIRFVAEMPASVCVNEILISPTWNRIFMR